MELSIVIHIGDSDTDNQLPVVTLDSPDQGAKGIPAQTDYCNSDSIAVSVPSLAMTYTGTIKGESIEGTFTQMGHSLPLSLTRGDVTLNRPQTPKPPFPYKTENVKFQSLADSVTLAGTLTLPADADVRTPVILMVSGSGLQNRDEELFGHKPFAVIADRLARAGIASLRYDDRGTAESTGNPQYATTADFALDAQGGIAFLRKLGYKNIGVLGHSEGGAIAFITASAKTDNPDFIITLGAPSLAGKDILLYQINRQMTTLGLNDDELKRVRTVLSLLFDTIVDNPQLSHKETAELIKSNLTENIKLHSASSDKATFILTSMATDSKIHDMYAADWMRYFLAYSPQTDISGAKVPVLALYGEKDTQVDPTINEAPMHKYNPSATIKVYPGLNHLMQPCITGDATEYATIDITMDEAVIADIIAFIKELSDTQR